VCATVFDSCSHFQTSCCCIFSGSGIPKDKFGSPVCYTDKMDPDVCHSLNVPPAQAASCASSPCVTTLYPSACPW
jgi:hypothetical protein